MIQFCMNLKASASFPSFKPFAFDRLLSRWNSTLYMLWLLLSNVFHILSSLTSVFLSYFKCFSCSSLFISNKKMLLLFLQSLFLLPCWMKNLIRCSSYLVWLVCLSPLPRWAYAKWQIVRIRESWFACGPGIVQIFFITNLSNIS